MGKRGQAALEFLTTYGWAFLVILVMIGALAYFGILDPTRFLPQRCQFGAEMHCQRFALDSVAGGAYFELQNALPEHLYVANIEWSVPEDNDWYPCEDEASINTVSVGPGNLGTGAVFNRENRADFVCEDATGGTSDTLTGMLISGDKQRVQFRITYNEGNEVASNYQKFIYGEIYANVK